MKEVCLSHKFSKFSFIFQKIREEDRAFVDAAFLFPSFWLLVFFIPVKYQPFKIGEGGFGHGFANARVVAKQEIEVSEEVCYHANADEGSCVEEGEVPGEQDVIVPESEKGFEVVLP
jgi:hypothetical protein